MGGPLLVGVSDIKVLPELCHPPKALQSRNPGGKENSAAEACLPLGVRVDGLERCSHFSGDVVFAGYLRGSTTDVSALRQRAGEEADLSAAVL